MEIVEVNASEIRAGDEIALHGELGTYHVVSMLDHAATGMVAFVIEQRGTVTPAAFYAGHRIGRVVR